jgi:hypothetical protein
MGSPNNIPRATAPSNNLPYDLARIISGDALKMKYSQQRHFWENVQGQQRANNGPSRGFGRQSNKGNAQGGKGNGTPSPTLSTPTSALPPTVPPVPQSPALSESMSLAGQPGLENQPPPQRRPPFFFREEYANLIVKGNFMTLAAKPHLVEDGEWLAHQGL